MPKLQKKVVRRVKVWIILNEGTIVGEIIEDGQYTFGAATFIKKRADDLVKRSNRRWEENKKVVKAELVYSLPLPNKRK